jgi:predicted AAA+ superfamily ATPase
VQARDAGRTGSLLVIDEVQKLPSWAETVKRLWDEDTAARVPLKVLLLGSAPLLIRKGLAEGLTGRFEVVRSNHWSYREMREAFGWSLEQYIYFGAYPGAAGLIADEARWRRYIVDSMIEPTLARDVFQIQRVDKPALLRQLFHLGCSYSGQILSFTKIVGQLQDAGNTTTIAHYLELLSAAGLLTGLPKFAGQKVRQRGSSPKFQALNNALITAQTELSFDEAKRDHRYWGRLLESTVGAHLVNEGLGVCYWREGSREVDFVLRKGRLIYALEVKGGRGSDSGLDEFAQAFRTTRILTVGTGGIPVDQFLDGPIGKWIA